MTNINNDTEFKRNATFFLHEWKQRHDRKPLIVRGARQVGKTFLINSFGKSNYENYIYLNLEKAEIKRLFATDISYNELELILKTQFGKELIPQKTLLFIDEIQNSPALFNLLRFFYEEHNDIHVVVAGSLLEVSLQEELISIPVGRVELLFIYPLNFYEYLSAIGQNELLNYIKSLSIGKIPLDIIHESILKHYYDYILVGGMPEAISGYIDRNFTDTYGSFYSSLMSTYIDDAKKYVKDSERKYLESVLSNVPGHAGKIFSYENFGNAGFKSREVSNAFSKLESALLLHQIKATTSTELPIESKDLRQKKLVFLDAGIISYSNGLTLHNNIGDYQSIYKSRIFEQVVGQELIATFTFDRPKLFYWAKDKDQGEAEVDYCIQHKDKIVGIEVKSKKGSTLRSLLSFSESVKNNFLVRVYSGKPILETVIYKEKRYKILSIPFYLVPRIHELIEDQISKN